jgi:hypothetical protein
MNILLHEEMWMSCNAMELKCEKREATGTSERKESDRRRAANEWKSKMEERGRKE